MNNLLILQNVNRIDKKGNWLLKKINLNIQKGQGIAFIGPNHSGKSELCKLIANEIEQTSGLIVYNFLHNDVKQFIGNQFKHTSWPKGYKTKNVVELYKVIYKIHDDEWLNHILDVFNIWEIWNRELSSCSYPHLQVFSLFLSIIHKPQLIIIDSISSSIGLDEKISILKFLKEYKQVYNATLIFNSPDNIVFEYLVDRLISIHEGKIFDDISKENILKESNFNIYSVKILDEISKNKFLYEIDSQLEPYLNDYSNLVSMFEKSFHPLIILGNKPYYSQKIRQVQLVRNMYYYFYEIKKIIENISRHKLKKNNFKNLKNNFKRLLKETHKYLKDFNISSNQKEAIEQLLNYLNSIILVKFSYKKIYSYFIKNDYLKEKDLNIEILKEDLIEVIKGKI